MEIDWATMALVGVVLLFLGFALFATFYDGPRKNNPPESVSESKHSK